MDLSTMMTEAVGRFESLKSAQDRQFAENRQRSIDTAIESFKKFFLESVSLEFAQSLPGFRFSWTDHKTSIAGCALFDLQDEFGNVWQAQILREYNSLALFIPHLEKEKSEHNARRRRKSDYRNWRRVKLIDGLTWQDCILLTIAGWNEEVEGLRIGLIADEIKDCRYLQESHDSELRRKLDLVSKSVDKTLDKIEVDRVTAVAKKMDSEIRNYVETLVKPKQQAIVYAWTWCTGAAYAEEGCDAEFDYRKTVSLQCKLAGGVLVDVWGKEFRLDPQVHKPYPEKVTLKLEETPHFDYRTKGRERRTVEVVLKNVHQVGNIYVYRKGCQASYEVEAFIPAIDDQVFPCEITVPVAEEVNEDDLAILETTDIPF